LLLAACSFIFIYTPKSRKSQPNISKKEIQGFLKRNFKIVRRYVREQAMPVPYWNNEGCSFSSNISVSSSREGNWERSSRPK
jgi:hypothetical protein